MAFSTTSGLASSLSSAGDSSLRDEILSFKRFLTSPESVRNHLQQVRCPVILLDGKLLIIGSLRASGKEAFLLQDIFSHKQEWIGYDYLLQPNAVIEVIESPSLLTGWNVHACEYTYKDSEQKQQESLEEYDIEDDDGSIQHLVISVPDENTTNAVIFLESASNPTSNSKTSGLRVYEVDGEEYELSDDTFILFNNETLTQNIKLHNPNSHPHDHLCVSLILDPSKIYLIEPTADLSETEQQIRVCSDRVLDVFDFTIAEDDDEEEYEEELEERQYM
mmetsp:Transcript_31873/g.39305  ORF Transcript_31873/g.39305 Transcript_31873/m.39305 type:complete len:277 (+) Transcript_31873:191-1021(+)|eukprot:CAMPEP_0204836632 /NCGR_PEP_ID=MMETSP1346-20131115/25727_1 /ASSEMBLY_ACC=CAM_ASM_000771 /TAXON_ID=215587 /ORGANISM="Aplanochytrium stocchinoi, Strain GSBS06" /LENGTH=276 /DNA_ID=CAMNT_0051971519 /DNA_START=185 /DNA_END=1015 /DNA_ORIENTATION=-